MRRFLILASLVISVFAVIAPSAIATRAEERQGAALMREFRSGKQSCASLSSTQFELVGEYVMARMIGSPAAHDAMNARIKRMMSPRGEAQAHIYLARRSLGCAQGVPPPAGFGPMMGVVGSRHFGGGMGGGMMGANGAGSGYNGNTGSGMMGNHHNGDGGWSTGMTALVVLVGGGLVVAVVLLAMYLSRRRELDPDSAP